MGFSLGKIVKKAVKGFVNLHKKAFKAVKKGAKKLWENKWTRMALIAGAVIAGGYALAAYSGGAGATAAGAGVTGTSSATGAATGAATATGTTAATTAAGAGTTAAGSGSLAAFEASMAPGVVSGGNVVGGSVAAGAGAGAGAGSTGLLSAAGNALAANPTLTLVGGMGLMNAAQAREADKQADKQREEEEKIRNAQSAYGVSYDGTTNVDINSGDKLMELNEQYRQKMLEQNAAPGAGILRRASPYKANGVA